MFAKPEASAGMAVKVVTRVTSNPRFTCSRFHRVWNNRPVATNKRAERVTSPATTMPLRRPRTERAPTPRDAPANARCGSDRETSNAGKNAESTVVTVAIAAKTTMTVQRSPIFSARGIVSAGSLRTNSIAK